MEQVQERGEIAARAVEQALEIGEVLRQRIDRSETGDIERRLQQRRERGEHGIDPRGEIARAEQALQQPGVVADLRRSAGELVGDRVGQRLRDADEIERAASLVHEVEERNGVELAEGEG